MMCTKTVLDVKFPSNVKPVLRSYFKIEEKVLST